MRVNMIAASLAFCCSMPVVAAVNISAPEDIQVIAINQQDVKTGVFSKKEGYTLSEGTHKISVRYHGFFEHHDHSHDVLKSDVFTLTTPELKSGQYHLALIDAPRDFEAAKQYQQQPIVGLYDQHKNLVAQQVGSKKNKSSWLNSINFTTSTQSQSDAQQITPVSQSETQQLSQQLIQIWQQASKQERQKFMQWIAENSN